MNRLLPAVALTVVVMLAAACGASPTSLSDDGDPVTIFGPYRETEADRFMESIAEFTAETGIEVRYTSSSGFVEDLIERVEVARVPPDIAIIPQPGVVDRFVETGAAVPLGPDTLDELDANYGDDVLAAFHDGEIRYTVPFRQTLKSVVWFRPDVFDEHGWRIPATLDDLEALVGEIAEAGELAPWCFSVEAGTATGWAATDWVEDLVLRRSGPEIYTQWSAGTIPFADPDIEAAFDEFRALVVDFGRTAGGVPSIVGTRVDRAWEPLLDEEPGCAMYKQADFALGWMPELSVGNDEELSWFVLPPAESAGLAPLVVGGDQAIRFDDRPAVSDVMTFLAGAQTGAPWVADGGFISAKTSIDETQYPPVERRFVDVLRDAPTLVFDASDQMSADVGSGLLWEAITNWIAGALTYEEFAGIVDDARNAE